jgi:tetratricopeptide (TPR) repeat protein
MFTSIDQFNKKYNYGLVAQSKCPEKNIVDILNGNVEKYLDNPSYYDYLSSYYLEIKRDYPNAEKYYKLGIGQNNVYSIRHYGSYFYNVKNDYVTAIQYWQKALDKKDYMCSKFIGITYFEKKKYKKAISYLKFALEHGEQEVIYSIARCYYAIQNYKQMIKFCKQGLRNNCDFCMNLMGIYYGKIRKDEDNEIKYLTMAIDQNNSDSMYNLGNAFYNKEMFKEAMPLYEKAIAKDDNSDITKLAACYFHLRIKYPEAVQLCKKAIINDKDPEHAAYASYILAKYNEEIIHNYEFALQYYILSICICNDIEEHMKSLNEAVSKVSNYNYLFDFFADFCKNRKIKCHKTSNGKINIMLKCISFKTKDFVYVD